MTQGLRTGAVLSAAARATLSITGGGMKHCQAFVRMTLAALCIAASTPASALLVDGFGTGRGGVSTDSTYPLMDQTFRADDALGGFRRLDAFSKSHEGNVSMAVTDAGTLVVNAQSGPDGCMFCRAAVFWDGEGSGLPQLSLADGNAFALKFGAIDGFFAITMQLWSGSWTATTIGLVVDALSSHQTLYLPLEPFSGNAGSADEADLLSQLDSIRLFITPFDGNREARPQATLQLDRVSFQFVPPDPDPDPGTVPLPSTLLLLAAAGLAARRVSMKHRATPRVGAALR